MMPVLITALCAAFVVIFVLAFLFALGPPKKPQPTEPRKWRSF